MQSMSRRGFTTLVNLSRFPNSYTLTSTQYAPRRICRIPRTTVLTYAANMHTTRKSQAVAAAVEAITDSSEQGDGSITKFEELAQHGLIHETIIGTITKSMGLATMTPVQSQTIKEAVHGVDTLALARTGTGKTVAFLLPVIQRILEAQPELERRQRRAAIDIRSIIISPTRELAEQIAQEAKRMVGNTGIEVGLAVGGTGRSNALREMNRCGCNILVGTPGRLNDLLSDPRSGIEAPKLNSFVLDEADRLLDDGFGPAVQEIYRHFPSKLEVDRQTLMFSATMDRAVMGMVSQFMKKDYRTVQTVGAGEIQTHEQVPQHVVVVNGLENQVPALFELIKRESMAVENFKAIVFFNTSSEAKLTRAIFNNSGLSKKIGIQGLEMHARLSQAVRTKTSANFRNSKRAIMFSSDVAARGMDFPNVTHVIQINLPKDRDTYIHRVGRTGRAGKEGQGWVLLAPWDECNYKRMLRDLPVKTDKSLETAALDMSQNLAISQGLADILTDAIQAARNIDFTTKSEAFRSVLSAGQSVDRGQLIDALNRRAKYGWGMDEPPAVSYGLASKLGFLKIRQLRIGEDERAPRRINERNTHGSYQNSRPRYSDSSPTQDTRRQFDSRRRNYSAGGAQSSRRAFSPSRES